jgi:hypothetical protein
MGPGKAPCDGPYPGSNKSTALRFGMGGQRLSRSVADGDRLMIGRRTNMTSRPHYLGHFEK